MRENNNDVRVGSVKLWHPWKDEKGQPKFLALWEKGVIYSKEGKHLFSVNTLSDFLHVVTSHSLFLLCNDILDQREFPFANELIGMSCATPYLTRTGGIPAMRLVGGKRRSGFVVPSSTWLWESRPDIEVLKNIDWIFQRCQFQSSTPASLSEKVLRETLPFDIKISRPSVQLRRDILDNNVGGRIDKAEVGKYYASIVEYDKNKAYLHHSRLVPSPMKSPVMRYLPTFEEICQYPTAWIKCKMIAHDLQRVPPIQLLGEKPQEGEIFTRWLWLGELQDCLEAGYELLYIEHGYGFEEMSNFMEDWSDVLWRLYVISQDQNEHIRKIIKSMMVGLPGRMLRRPETYVLIPIGDAVDGLDVPLTMKWIEEGDKMFSDYAVHPIYDKESTSLSQVGSYIVAEMRRELYHKMIEQERLGNPMVRSYIDSLAFEKEVQQGIELGDGLGQYKKKNYWNVYAEENRFVAQPDPYGWEGDTLVAPGYGAEKRINFMQKYSRENRQKSLDKTP